MPAIRYARSLAGTPQSLATTEDIREGLYEVAEALVQAGRAYAEMLIGEEK